MANCNLVGPIPSWIGNLKELRQLDLQHNNISGKLPKEIGNLVNLLYLNVKDNSNLGGEVLVESFSKLNKLNRLSLVNCNFVNTQDALELLQVRLPRCRIWI